MDKPLFDDRTTHHSGPFSNDNSIIIPQPLDGLLMPWSDDPNANYKNPLDQPESKPLTMTGKKPDNVPILLKDFETPNVQNGSSPNPIDAPNLKADAPGMPNTPQMDTPNMPNAPKVDTPNVPKVDTPDAPKVENPEMPKQPEVNAPEMKKPDVPSLPDQPEQKFSQDVPKAPTVKADPIEKPNIEQPSVNTPSGP
jgi:hypothetical protein